MDENEPGGSAGVRDRRLGRGLEDVSHLFLTNKTGGASSRDRAAVNTPERSSPLPEARGDVVLLRPASFTRDEVALILMDADGAPEDGLKAIDAKIACPPCGEIDLLAVDRANQLAIIDFETASNDGLLLRGVGHFDWVVRNLANVQRMYREHAINFSPPPRLFLLAPQFSPVLRSVARQLRHPKIHWVRYHTVSTSGGSGILFEPVVGE
jgi:hypothetical protein